MITVLTGTPGAGKTLYAISKLLAPLVGTFAEKRHDDGTVEKIPVKIFTNINGLLIDHELIQADGPEGLLNWQSWAQPGSVICFDEFQKVWPPRPNGAAVPPSISALDTHRHMGVDFILITQNVMNVDRHIHGLTNRHLHVRRLGNMATAVVYEFDHCSRQLLYSKSITKAVWRYDKKVFKLYKSAELHTKQPRRIPALIWIVLAALVLAPLLGWNFFERIKAKAAPAPAIEAAMKKDANSIHGLQRSLPQGASHTSTVSPVAVASGTRGKPRMSGCIALGERCECSDAEGNPVELVPSLCEALQSPRAAIPEEFFAGVPEATGVAFRAESHAARLEADVSVIEFASQRRASRAAH